AFTVRHVAIYVFSQRLWPVRYRWAPVLRLCAVALAVAGVGYFLPPASLLASLALRGALLAVYFIALWNMDVLTPDDRLVARRVLRTVRARVAGRFFARQQAGEA
ncbi:MAG TPA: hypothetical protein VKA84_21530, partial [Gemmatimonadaceae bacterium]|nr:hypothetical protein [Gemmatimonadaceae bacterium]